MREGVARLLCALGAPALFRWLHRRRLLVLMYHGVVERPADPPCWYQLPAEAFRRQLAWVAARYRVLPLEEALERWAAGTLPPRACAITFDDGFRNVRTVAGPALDALRLPAAVFVATGAIGTGRRLWPDRLWLALTTTGEREADLSALDLGRVPLPDAAARAAAFEAAVARLKELPRARKEEVLEGLCRALGEPADPGEFRMMDWAEVGGLAAGGRVAVGAHTVRHEILSRCEDDVVRREVADSVAEVVRRLGRAPPVFAWPNGRPRDVDGRAVAAAKESGIRFALSTTEGLVGPGADPMALPRVAVGADLSFARFRLLASGVLPRPGRRATGYGPTSSR